MPKIYFGKFDWNKTEQIEELFYAAGPEGVSWYGGIQPGDYVFPVSNSQVLGLWKVRRYGEKPNRINQESSGVVFFDSVKTFDKPITVQQFIKSPYFDLNINLLNKILRPTRGCGFFEIKTNPRLFPERIEEIAFSKERNIYIALEHSLRPQLQSNDILVIINNLTEARITGFQVFINEEFIEYKPLRELYEEKNIEDKRYTLHQLLEYAKEEAPNKEKYIVSVLKELKDRGYFAANNPIQLYDNILVGRRRTPRTGMSETGSEEALSSEYEEEQMESLDDYMQYAELLEFNPNLILYGPPGTGKTFTTKKIIEAFEASRSQSVPCEQVEKEGRMKFVTFHQSYSYEEFVEGIRPHFEEDASENSEGNLSYKIQDGILKKIVQLASAQILREENSSSGAEQIKQTSKIWKVSLGRRNEDIIYDRCKQKNFIAVGWLNNQDLTDKSYDEIYSLLENERNKDAKKPLQDANTLDLLINYMSVGDIVLIYDSPTTIRDIGIITGEYKYLTDEEYPHTRNVTWLKEFQEAADIFEMNGGVRLTLKTIYELERMNLSDIQSLVSSGQTRDQLNAQKASPKPYYLVIDEINRGNISKIFGELITLIEKDKRQTWNVTLPYSNKPFTLPRNLYMIGTMNTADRSIAMLDTALRRRFVFVEVEPDYTVFSKYHAKVNNMIDLEKLLKSLNESISNKLDRDHRIGHAYFMDIFTLDELYKAWYYKVLPLVAEYFYNDVAAIKSVVGKKFFDSSGSVRFLSMKSVEEGLTEFEKALLEIYEGKKE